MSGFTQIARGGRTLMARELWDWALCLVPTDMNVRETVGAGWR